MPELCVRCIQFNEGLITSRELLGHFVHIVGTVWQEGTDENETEAIAKLAGFLALAVVNQSQL